MYTVLSRCLGFLLSLFSFLSGISVYAQTGEKPLRYGDMDQWVVRRITESAIMGKEVRTLYAVGPTDTILGNKAYESKDSPWATSNVYARVSGITKASASVYPEKRGEGFCARMETGIEVCKALGIINLKALVSGCLFLGKTLEPINGVSDPWSHIVSGIAFSGHPQGLLLDYKVKLSGERDRIKLDGFRKQSTVRGMDMPLIRLLLQKRWEDKDGNLYAKRVGTLVVTLDKNTEWEEGSYFRILYGDITSTTGYDARMGLITGEESRHGLNSRGRNVPIQEIGWGVEKDEVTHIILEFCSSHGGSYVGSPGNMLWVDNVRLRY